MTIKSVLLATVTGLLMSVVSASAGPFIISGTDSDDHGTVSGGVNQAGWLYMQKAIENIAGGVTNGFTNIVTLGTSAGQALDAANSAFGLSSIGATWSMTHIDGTLALANYFAGTGSVNKNNTGIILIDSGDNVAGGIDSTEDAVLTANAAALNAFVAGGGGLFPQASDLRWLSALIPGIVITDIGTGGDSSALLLTAAGSTAFPGLTN